MKPVNFRRANTAVYPKGRQGGYPAEIFKDVWNTPSAGEWITTRWRASLAERLKILFTGTIWMTIADHKQPLSCLETNPNTIPIKKRKGG